MSKEEVDLMAFLQDVRLALRAEIDAEKLETKELQWALREFVGSKDISTQNDCAYAAALLAVLYKRLSPVPQAKDP